MTPNHAWKMCAISTEVRKGGCKGISPAEVKQWSRRRTSETQATQRQVWAPELALYILQHYFHAFFYGRQRNQLIKLTGKPWRAASRNCRLSAAGERGEPLQTGLRVWNATDSCRQTECIITTGDPCLHHLCLFLEQLHDPPLFTLQVSVLNVLPEVQTAPKCKRVDDLSRTFRSKACRQLNVSLEQSHYVWIMQMKNKHRLLCSQDEQSNESWESLDSYSNPGQQVFPSVPPLRLSDWSCSNKSNHLV